MDFKHFLRMVIGLVGMAIVGVVGLLIVNYYAKEKDADTAVKTPVSATSDVVKQNTVPKTRPGLVPLNPAQIDGSVKVR